LDRKTLEEAKMKRLSVVVGMALSLLIGTFVAQSVFAAGIGPDPKTSARDSRIVGLWDVEVSVENCMTGVPVASFVAMHKYELGGTGQVVPASNPTALSEHSMIWSHVKGNDYRMAAKMFRFDAIGNYIGWIVIRNEVSINKHADEYVGSGTAEIFNTAGDFVGVSCPSFIGTRFTGE